MFLPCFVELNPTMFTPLLSQKEGHQIFSKRYRIPYIIYYYIQYVVCCMCVTSRYIDMKAGTLELYDISCWQLSLTMYPCLSAESHPNVIAAGPWICWHHADLQKVIERSCGSKSQALRCSQGLKRAASCIFPEDSLQHMTSRARFRVQILIDHGRSGPKTNNRCHLAFH